MESLPFASAWRNLKLFDYPDVVEVQKREQENRVEAEGTVGNLAGGKTREMKQEFKFTDVKSQQHSPSY